MPMRPPAQHHLPAQQQLPAQQLVPHQQQPYQQQQQQQMRGPQPTLEQIHLQQQQQQPQQQFRQAASVGAPSLQLPPLLPAGAGVSRLAVQGRLPAGSPTAGRQEAASDSLAASWQYSGNADHRAMQVWTAEDHSIASDHEIT